MPRTKLTEDEIKRWRNEISTAIKYREDEFGVYDMQKPKGAGIYYALYDNIDFTLDDNGDLVRTEVSANQVRPNTKQFLSSSYYQNPWLEFSSERKDDNLYAPIMEKVINKLYKRLGVKEQNEFAIQNAYLSDLGATEEGYVMDIVRFSEEKAEEVKKGFLEQAKEFVTGKKKKDDAEAYNEFIRYENPFIKSIFPFNLLFPFYANEIREMPWAGKQILQDMNYIHNFFPETRYLKGNEVSYQGSNDRKDYSGTNIENFKQMHVFWLFLKTGCIDGVEELSSLVFLGNESGVTHPDPVWFGRLPLPIDGLPITFLQFNKTQGKIYSVSEVGSIAGLQHKLDILVSRLYDLARKYNQKILYDENAFKGVGMLGKLKNVSDVFVGVTGGAGIIQLAMSEPKETSKIPPEILKTIEFLISEIRRESGITESSLLGESQAEFATTEQIGAGGMAARMSKAGDRINDFVIEQAEQFTKICRKYLPLSEVEKIVGESAIDLSSGQKMPIEWPKFVDKWQRGEYDLSINVSSMQKPNPMADQKNAVEWSKVLFSPQTQALLALENKKIKASKVIELLGKSFNQQAEDFVEDIQQPETPGLPGMGGGGGEMPPGGAGTEVPPGGEELLPMPEELMARIEGKV